MIPATLLPLLLYAGVWGHPVAAAPCRAGEVRYVADPARSTIEWLGTRLMGRHEGTVQLASGDVCVRGERITSAHFIADMTSIEVTDIPAHEPVPRRRLLDHLKGEDFFHVAAHPTARLRVLSVAPARGAAHRVRAELTLRGQTHPLTFNARVAPSGEQLTASARLVLDRHRWGVNYVRRTVRDHLVHDEFTLELRLAAQRVP